MYIKTMHRSNDAYGNEVSDLYSCGKTIRYGCVALNPKDLPQDWPQVLGIEANAFGNIDISENLAQIGWVKWAWWWDETPNHSIVFVVTDGKMFVMNDNGSTIEQIR